MSSAEVTTVTTVHLEMTLEEAQTLATVLSYVGGNPATSRRGHTDNITAALGSVGVAGFSIFADDNPVERNYNGLSSVIFKDNM